MKYMQKLLYVLYDICCIPLSWFLAYSLRYNLEQVPSTWLNDHTLAVLPVLLVTQVFSYYIFKVYLGIWRFASLDDLLSIVKSVVTTSIIMIPMLYMLQLLAYVPRSVLPLYAIISMILLSSGRLLQRVLYAKSAFSFTAKREYALIIGAGQAGEWLVRDIKRMGNYLLVGLIDDDVKKFGMSVHGIRVLGNTEDLSKIAKTYHIDLIFIAIPSLTSGDMRRIVGILENINIPFRTLPSLQALASGKVALQDLRTVKIEDLLGRDKVASDWSQVYATIRSRRVIVTGGGGSIGSELCMQILNAKPESLCIIEHSEYNLFKIEQHCKRYFPDSVIVPMLISVTDKAAIMDIFSHYQPHFVFHAAAYKHVPMLENQVCTAVKNNVLGTINVAIAAAEVNALKFVLISTDKAVNPSNVMGVTKRISEIYCQNMCFDAPTEFITVRFGNVLGSVGSVIPLFQEQLQRGGPITVTHPDIERYFMTITEASELILQAASMGTSGDIFVLDMGEPIKISYLAEQMIKLSGKEPFTEIKIIYTGLRPGEKLFEELFHKSEDLVPTIHQKIFKAKYRELSLSNFLELINKMQEFLDLSDEAMVLEYLKVLVPEAKITAGLVF
jgi:FlaA1/EpsC-like NDP-sugar epimerase